MAEYWTIQQAAANAELFAREFSNRQILLYGLGDPILQAPLGVEYEDRAFTPPKRFRKVGTEPTDWIEIKIIEAATEEEVNNGVSDSKMITPLSLSKRLGTFSEQLLGIPQPVISSDKNGITVLSASSGETNSNFELTLPQNITTTMLPIRIVEYGINSSLKNIIGGELGQILTLRRGEDHALKIESSESIKLSSEFTLNDTHQLDNITLQRLTPSIWGELTRKKFT